MNTEALFLFLILLLGLVLCSFLGGNCGREPFETKHNSSKSDNRSHSGTGSSTASPTQYDNYNHFDRSHTELQPGSTYYGPKGTTATVNANKDGTQSLQITLPGSSTPITLSSSQSSTNDVPKVESYTNYYGNITTYYGPDGIKATVVTMANGAKAIKVTTPKGTYYYNSTTVNLYDTNTSTQYYGSTGYQVQQTPYATAYQNEPTMTTSGSSSSSKNSYSSANSSGKYNDSLPPGIPRSQIPPGQEDLYILKSEVVPPVCPACPTCNNAGILEKLQQEKCPPCPACARCPEPAFECKKVPNYSAIDNNQLPVPVLNDFSQFGM